MKIQFLPSTFDSTGRAAARQHLPSFVFDDCLAIDAGSLALAISDEQRETVRDVVITHSHLDHIATLPILIDDLFGSLTEPIRVHAAPETIEALETHIFNWRIFPRFSELKNDFGVTVMEYRPFTPRQTFAARHLRVTPIAVNHQIPTCGMLIADNEKSVAFTSDTAENQDFWQVLNAQTALDALLIECAFPDSKSDLARISHHLTPRLLDRELDKLRHDCEIFVINLKPVYRREIVAELSALNRVRLRVMPTFTPCYI